MDRRIAVAALGGGLGALLLGAHAPRAQAQTPSLSGRSLRVVVGHPAGGMADFVARTVVDGVRQATGAAAIVENRPGAGGNIAREHVARQAPDAGVFGVFPNSIVTMNPFVPALAAKGLDANRDLVPVAALAALADMILLLAVSSQMGVATLDEFLARARAPGARLRVGIAGTGTPHHLSTVLLEQAAGLELTMVPYKGGAPMIADAAGGHLDAVFTTVPVGGPLVDSGKLHWIAIAQPGPIATLPGLPSLVGVFKGQSIPSWIGVFASAATPPDLVASVHAALNAASGSPAIAAKLRSNGLEPLSLSQAQTAKLIADETRFMKDFLSRTKVDFST